MIINSSSFNRREREARTHAGQCFCSPILASFYATGDCTVTARPRDRGGLIFLTSLLFLASCVALVRDLLSISLPASQCCFAITFVRHFPLHCILFHSVAINSTSSLPTRVFWRSVAELVDWCAAGR